MNTNLELTIDEPIESHFYWTIAWHGQAGEVSRVVDYSRGPLPTRGMATAAALAALLRHQDDEADIGALALRARPDPIAEAVGRLR